MNEIGKPERETPQRLTTLFREELQSRKLCTQLSWSVKDFRSRQRFLEPTALCSEFCCWTCRTMKRLLLSVQAVWET